MYIYVWVCECIAREVLCSHLLSLVFLPSLYDFLSSAEHKEDILKNTGNQKSLNPYWLSLNGQKNPLFLKMSFFFFCSPQRKDNHTVLEQQEDE